MRAKRGIAAALVAAVSCVSILAACDGGGTGNPPDDGKATDFNPAVTVKELSREEYVNKTLGGLLGQFSGFLSGYEFVWRGSDPYIGMPEEWFEFINGPYAGNYEHYTPVDPWRYDRLRVNPATGKNEVYSDDDYHIDIFNQYIIDELGTSSYAVKETWKKYNVSDWGGGQGASDLIAAHDMLSPFTGTIEGGNRYGWCTEAYIETETLGMNAPGMPNAATDLVDTFGANVGYFESLMWGKFYAAMYSLAYFETDIVTVMEKAKATLPVGSYPRKIYDAAFEAYAQNPDDYRAAGMEIHNMRRNVYRMDNVQTDPNVNGGFAVLSWLYGKNSYLDTCKYSSILGYDGDCTAATCTGVMGILKGFKKGNEEYNKLNDMIYYDGEGVYFNDDGSTYEGEIYQARIRSKEYPTRQKIDDIVDMYRKNFEKILVENGGSVEGDKYVIPTTPLIKEHAFLFENFDAEERDTRGFTAANGKLEVVEEGENENSHSGFAAFKLTNTKEGEAYHTFSGLATGKTYRLSAYVKTDGDAQVSIFARGGGKTQEMTFANAKQPLNKAFVFTAASSEMTVGFKFSASSAKGDVLYFDDFMLEEIEREQLAEAADNTLKPFTDKYSKTVKKPEGVKVGEEVVLCVEYRNAGGSALNVTVNRNGKPFGGVVVSNTSKNATSGSAVLEIPYVFEKETDAIQLEFTGGKLHVGGVNIYRKAQYTFR